MHDVHRFVLSESAGAKRDLLDVVKVDVLCDGLPPEAEERQTQAVREEAAAAGKVLALSSPLPEEEKELSLFHLDLPKIPQSGMSEIATVLRASPFRWSHVVSSASFISVMKKDERNLVNQSGTGGRTAKKCEVRRTMLSKNQVT